MIKLALLLLILSLFCTPASGQHPAWINVKDYGTKATLGTDDTPSITAAINAALARPQYQGETVVYFPSSPGYYDIKTPLVMPRANKRITLCFDSALYIEATITIHGGYTLRGTESGNGSFNPSGGSPFYVGHNVNPAIHIQAVGLTLENIFVGYIHDQSDGIVIDSSSSDIKLKNVGASTDASNKKGIPLKIIGGFGYDIDGGGYTSSGAPAIQFNDDPKICSSTGIVRIHNIFLGGNAIQLHNHCGVTNSISIDGALYENSAYPFLTAIVDGGSPIMGVELRNVNMADSWVSPMPPLVNVQSGGTPGIKNMTIVNSSTDGPAQTTGDPIWGLEIWSSRDYVAGAIAQKDHFIYHGPHGIKDTMPRLP
jgi:Pectate lyase superfamily protein